MIPSAKSAKSQPAELRCLCEPLCQDLTQCLTRIRSELLHKERVASFLQKREEAVKARTLSNETNAS